MNYLFWIFLLLLPTQLGKHWWPEWSLVDGVRVDYLSPTIYLTDIVLLLVAALALFKNRRIFNFQFSIFNEFSIFNFQKILIVSYLLLITLSSPPRIWLAVYWLARYLEIILVAWVTVRSQKPEARSQIYRALAIGVLFSVGLGIIQMFLGRTTGWWWILGERNFTLADPGIATMTVWGREILRPYATFSHPNALAGFLAAAMMEYGVGSKEYGIRKKENRIWRKVVLLVGVIGVILTGSRGAILGLVVGYGLWVVSRGVRNWKKFVKLAGLGILGGLTLLASAPQYAYFGSWSTSTQPKSATTGFGRTSGFLQSKNPGPSEKERLVLVRAAVRMWRDNWLTGVGPGQFLVKLPEYLPAGFYKIQPVHNIFLLGLAEFGVIGMGIIVITIIKIIKLAVGPDLIGASLKWALAVILVTGMVDHYWLTAQQNRLLLGLILGLIHTNSKSEILNSKQITNSNI